MSTIPVINSYIQSPYLYCQAVGSQHPDQTKSGVHLRWDLLKELGNAHIPKGNMAGRPTGFNKPNDFVTIYRSLYNSWKPNYIEVDFNNIDKTKVAYLHNNEGISYNLTTALGRNVNILVRFLNRAKFKQILDQGLDPKNPNPVQDFLNRYNGIIEVEVENSLMYEYRIDFTNGNFGDALFETVFTKDRFDTQSNQVVKREERRGPDLTSSGVKTQGENIKYFRVQQNGMPAPSTLTIFTYEDLFAETQANGNWDYVGSFGLSDDDTTVYSQFQGSSYTPGNSLELQWPKYNDGVMLVADNYKDRWENGTDGLKTTIQQFIQLSDTDPRANTNLPSDAGDPNGLTVSLLDMLKLVGLDYHGARMMGLGHIDTYPNYEYFLPYVYAAVYTTGPSLPNVGANADHVFLTLPTATIDSRLPVAPRLEGIFYGLYVSTDDSGTSQLLSDEHGYSFYDDTRFVNLNKTNQLSPQPVLNYIPHANEFDATQITQPVSFGIEYKEAHESTWRAPEILQDDVYFGSDGLAETVTTPEREANPLYTHREKEAGVHQYGVYSVNWFSRVSPVSNTQQTDTTAFPKRNTLLPPSNFTVQYIQEEDPRVFTTAAEQAILEGLNTANPTIDNYKTRLTFDWDNFHNNAYQYANKVEFFFRDTPIKKVEGQIKAISIGNDDSECIVSTRPFRIASIVPYQTISPNITPGEESRFVGSLLNTQEGQFTILGITQPTVAGEGPVFRLRRLVSNQLLQANASDPFITVPTYTGPNPNDVFFIFENINAANGWSQLAKTVDLVQFSTAQETVTEEDGSDHLERVGGINETAQITEILDAGNPTGGYTITFNSYNLLPHSDTDITWIKGSVRLAWNSAPLKKKKLPVVSLQQTAHLTLVVFDPDYMNVPAERILTGSQTVNYHPGYKLYLNPQSGVFEKSNTMPAVNENNKKTYLAARSVDTSYSNHSPLTPPAVLVARNILKPVAPQSLVGPLFATRPDFYGKSTYTIDVQLNTAGSRVPYGLQVYRANEMSILQALYLPATVKQVMTNLEAIATNDPEKHIRWKSLLDVETDPNDGNQFRPWGAYRFPNPDNNNTLYYTNADTTTTPFPLQSGQTLVSQRVVIKKVLENVFTPLAETPVIFSYLKSGYQTSSEQPVTKSIIGKWLDPTDATFNPFPMAVKFPAASPNTVRFTDYTLSGNAKNIYFYFAKEIAIDGKLSDRTSIFGPVLLVNATPAEKPVVRKITTQEASPLLNLKPSVRFDVAEYISSEDIKQYQVFRSYNVAEAATVRTMQLATTANVADTVEDKFDGLVYPPFGQPLFYRVVALREIMNEAGNVEMIPSQPSEMILSNVIDVINPEAPELEYSNLGISAGPNGEINALLNVSISWLQSVYNGTYYLYKMNSKENWELLTKIKTNDSQTTFPVNGDFTNYPQMETLLKIDDDGNTIYHRFKVSVENASGLFNLEDKELII